MRLSCTCFAINYPESNTFVFSVLEEATGAEIVITDVRVEQTDDGSVDTTG